MVMFTTPVGLAPGEAGVSPPEEPQPAVSAIAARTRATRPTMPIETRLIVCPLLSKSSRLQHDRSGEVPRPVRVEAFGLGQQAGDPMHADELRHRVELAGDCLLYTS